MTEEIIIAGFGGQGVLSMGKIMAYSGMMQDMEVSWMPSYGPEMRGGTANVNVILSDERISSPILRSFDTAIILNQQSLDKFEKSVKPGGVLIYDGNGITRHPERKDISVYRIDAAEEASKMDMQRVFNMFVLGGFMKVKPILKTECGVITVLIFSTALRDKVFVTEQQINVKKLIFFRVKGSIF